MLSDYLIFKQTFLDPVGVLPHDKEKVKIKIMSSINRSEEHPYVIFSFERQNGRRKEEQEKEKRREKKGKSKKEDDERKKMQ